MTAASEHEVGLRELRHNTREVMDRVQGGEVIDITDHGRRVARLSPAPDEDTELPPALARLVATGRAKLPTRAAYVPAMHPGDGTNLLSDTLQQLRDEERW